MPRVAMSSLGGGARSALTAGQNESWRALQEDAVAGQSSSSDSSAPASLEHAELPRHSTVSRFKKTMVKAPLGTVLGRRGRALKKIRTRQKLKAGGAPGPARRAAVAEPGRKKTALQSALRKIATRGN
ncbi:hypothetical protein JL721_10038 [Aureococcus anophagefferens]|nr:hypothetical protein JL721_10038 [Aureococcus anophagefferens]